MVGIFVEKWALWCVPQILGKGLVFRATAVTATCKQSSRSYSGTFPASHLLCVSPSLLPVLLRVSTVLSWPSVFEAAWGELQSKVLNMRLVFAKPLYEVLEWPLGHYQSHGNPQSHWFPCGEVLGARL